MARPIEPTPVLKGEDVARLIHELRRICTDEEAKRRVAAARSFLDKIMIPQANDWPHRR